MKKMKYSFVVVAIILSSILYKKVFKNSFEYFYTFCEIFNREGQLLYKLNDYKLCAFSQDGSVLASDWADRLTLFDKNDEIIWTSNEYVHHDLKFSNDGQNILVISAEVISYKNLKSRSDCFSVRSRKNEIIHRWCVHDHLEDLNRLGYYIDSPRETDPLLPTKIAAAPYEISHANSIYEIGENTRSHFDKAFEAGNYIVHLGGSKILYQRPICALLILDREMKNILWHKNYCNLQFGTQMYQAYTHDNQVTKEGNILTYINSVKKIIIPFYSKENTLKKINSLDFENWFLVNLSFDRGEINHNWYSSLVEFDPYTEAIYWRFTDSPANNFQAMFNGTVTKLDNGNYLYSDVKGKGDGFEISSKGKKIWSTSSAEKLNGKPPRIDKIKPLLDSSFLKVRNL